MHAHPRAEQTRKSHPLSGVPRSEPRSDGVPRVAVVATSRVECHTGRMLVIVACLAADWRASLQNAVTAHQSGDLVGALPHYRSAIAEHAPLRQAPPVLTNYGLVVQASGQLDEAVAAFRSVIDLTPGDANAHFNLGNALMDAGEAEGAAGAFRTCVQLSPRDGEAYCNLGVALLLQANAPAAVDALRTSISMEPGDAKTHVSLGDGLAKLGAWEESVAAYRTASRLRPAHANTHASLGVALDELGELEAAEASWRTAARLSPAESAGTLCNLGALLRRTDRMVEGQHAYRQAIALEPRSADAYAGLGRCFQAPLGGSLLAGGVEASSSYLRHLKETYGMAVALRPSDAGSYTAIGEGMRMFGLHGGCEEFDGEGAQQMYKHALALMPSNTCAATHVAYGERPPRDADEIDLLSGQGAVDAHEDALTPEVGTDGVGAPLASTIEELSIRLPLASAEDEADLMTRWQRHGAVSFPGLLSSRTTDLLLAHVHAAQHGNYTSDYTQVTRDKTHRCHKALPVGQAQAALNEIARALQLFFERALGTPRQALLESGFMVTAPGASAQNFHRDVAPAFVSCSSMTVSVQVRTAHTPPLLDGARQRHCSHVADACPPDPIVPLTRGSLCPAVLLYCQPIPAGESCRYRGNAGRARADSGLAGLRPLRL